MWFLAFIQFGKKIGVFDLFEQVNALRHYGFVNVADKFYYGTRAFNAKDYTPLISIYSAHKTMPEESRIPFLKEIAETIDCCGGKFTLSDIMFLCMGRKP